VAHERTRGEDRVLISIQVANVDDAVRDLQAKGVQIVQAATDRPQWALRTAHFRDPDSNLIEINHDIPMGNGG
jgi:predicted enzyme related to lactoylglutathione lyase